MRDMYALKNRQVKRLFAFGCSFTNYHWTTWPEIVAEDLEVDEYYNLAVPAAGNELIFNRLMQVDRVFNLGSDDLVMICWTSFNREDRYVNKRWMVAGNIYSQTIYPPEFVRSYYPDPEDAMLHDFAYIRASRVLLEHRGVACHMMQMSDITERLDDWSDKTIENKDDLYELFDNEMLHIKPSFFNVLWGNDISGRSNLDAHPSPMEHFEYLRKVFEHDWKPSTILKVQALEDEFRERFKTFTCHADVSQAEFNRLRHPTHINEIR